MPQGWTPENWPLSSGYADQDEAETSETGFTKDWKSNSNNRKVE